MRFPRRTRIDYHKKAMGMAVAMVLTVAACSFPVRAGCAGAVVDSTAAADSVVGAKDFEGRISRKPSAPRACITLEKGEKIILEMMPAEAPLAVERITGLINEGFYDGLKFHRVLDFLAQTGKKESPLPPVEGEMFFQDLRHQVGMVGMARLPDDYNSATTQFYIVKEYRSSLNGEYTIFARVVEGMEIVQKIKKGDKIETIKLIE
ncbi:MAG: peptidylprolyl isomerase [Candidatus Krumholzibacteriota bacterium]|nr:peptidylprolyl isomerase [Candidatus Krumholzibacteriota bacterium]